MLCLYMALSLTACQQSHQNQIKPLSNQHYNGPIIDMHFHIDGKNSLPPVELGFCIPVSTMIPYHDPKDSFGDVWNKALSEPTCDDPLWSPKSYETYLTKVKSQLNQHQILAVTSADLEEVIKIKTMLPNHIIPGFQFRLGKDNYSPEQLKVLFIENDIKVFGEITNQYGNTAPDDPNMFPYYKMAEELDIPVGIHLGSGLPGIMYHWEPEYRAKLSNPLALEEVLREFPKLRIYIMHYGEPFIDELITMMYHYPQIYIDLGGMQWNYPTEYFYEYHLKKIMTAGFGKRIMFGSDFIIWPEFIEQSIDIINQAPFLNQQQKADIFYNNAARFLRLNQLQD